MKYVADVVHLTARPQDDDRFSVVPIEARDDWAAARAVAHIAAERKFGELGTVGFINGAGSSGTRSMFRAHIGVQERCETGLVTRGVSVSIAVYAQGGME
jgi:hypothetical protein